MSPIPTNPIATAWTMHIPVISTAHMPHSQAAFEIQDTTVAAYPEGAFVRVSFEEAFTNDEWLRPVRDWLSKTSLSDCWVRFDRDGDIVPGLPMFDWAAERECAV